MTKKEMLINYIKSNEADGIILFNTFNRFWLLELETSFGIVVANKEGKMIFITDSRYILVARETLKNVAEVWMLNEKPGDTVKNLIDKAVKELKIDKMIIEKDYLSLSNYDHVKDYNVLPLQTNWIRAIKTEEEIKKLQKSADITASVIEWVWSWIKPGFTEKEIAKKICIKFLELGAEGNSFDPIVAAGLNGACPHHKPSDYVIQDGDMVTIDMGCMFEHYASDMTRTFVVGSKCNNEEMLVIYDTVKTAQEKGLALCKIGNSTKAVDAACREHIENSPYKGLFQHGTGHGVGVEVHEMPNVSPSCDVKLVKNHVVTVEPGIYKANVGGVRIEDTVIIRDGELIVTTQRVPKTLQYIVNK